MTMIPTPPSQWVMARQRRRPAGRLSSPVNTVAPVVVKPETDSNTASTGRAPVAPSMKGSAPKRGSSTQTVVVRTKVWRIVSDSATALEEASAIRPPMMMVMSALKAKAGQWSLPLAMSAIMGPSIATPSATSRRPFT